MKKTIKVNIGGMVFHLDEDAYQSLQSYLDALKRKFGTAEEGKEIIEDIESRIVELLQNQIAPKKESISQENIQEVITILGKPEDYEEGEKASPEGPKEADYPRTTNRRLYRDQENAFLGGVSGGMGAYFNVDPLIFRILFFALIFASGLGIILYIVLWIVLPVARTSAQRLEMRGQPVTAESISRSVKEEYEQIRKNVNGETPAWRRIREGIGEMLNVFLVILKSILRVVGVIIGGIFILFGCLVLFGFLTALIIHKSILDGIFDGGIYTLPELAQMFLPGADFNLLLITMILVIGLPLSAMVYWGLKILLRFKANDKWIGIVLFFTWFFSVVLLVSLMSTQMPHYDKKAEKVQQVILDSVPGKTYELGVNDSLLLQVKKDAVYIEKEEFGIYYNKSRKKFFGKPELNIQKAEGNRAEIVVSRESLGSDHREASDFAEEIAYHWRWNGNRINLDALYVMPDERPWRGQWVDIDLLLPVGSEVWIPEEMEIILGWSDMAEWEQPWRMGGKRWKMTEEGLVEIK